MMCAQSRDLHSRQLAVFDETRLNASDQAWEAFDALSRRQQELNDSLLAVSIGLSGLWAAFGWHLKGMNGGRYENTALCT